VAGFDPDAYLAEKTSTRPAAAFDPDAYLADKDSSRGQQERSAAFAAMKGVQDIPTMGFGDELGGALQAGLTKGAKALADELSPAAKEWVADNLGVELDRRGRSEEAIQHYRETLRIKPGDRHGAVRHDAPLKGETGLRFHRRCHRNTFACRNSSGRISNCGRA